METLKGHQWIIDQNINSINPKSCWRETSMQDVREEPGHDLDERSRLTHKYFHLLPRQHESCRIELSLREVKRQNDMWIPASQSICIWMVGSKARISFLSLFASYLVGHIRTHSRQLISCHTLEILWTSKSAEQHIVWLRQHMSVHVSLWATSRRFGQSSSGDEA